MPDRGHGLFGERRQVGRMAIVGDLSWTLPAGNGARDRVKH
jgi:hypothetical protein